MFEDIQKHRQAVAENIEKSFQIGYTGSEDLEKAHNVGDIHPNGKWVWTQLPSGKYDWRVIKKKTAQGAGNTVSTQSNNVPKSSVPSSSQKTDDNKKTTTPTPSVQKKPDGKMTKIIFYTPKEIAEELAKANGTKAVARKGDMRFKNWSDNGAHYDVEDVYEVKLRDGNKVQIGKMFNKEPKEPWMEGRYGDIVFRTGYNKLTPSGRTSFAWRSDALSTYTPGNSLRIFAESSYISPYLKHVFNW